MPAEPPICWDLGQLQSAPEVILKIVAMASLGRVGIGGEEPPVSDCGARTALQTQDSYCVV